MPRQLFEGLSRVGLGALLGVSALLATPFVRAQQPDPTGATRPRAGRPATAVDRVDQDTATGNRSEATVPNAEGRVPAAERRAPRPEGRPAREAEDQGEAVDPFHEDLLGDARERVEVLEAQLAAKRAHIRLAEARLKEAQDRLAHLKRKGGSNADDEEKTALLAAEIPVLEAERDAEHAEIREPEVLLKHARWRVEEIEKMAQPNPRRGVLGRLRQQRQGQGGMGMMGHPGFGPYAIGSMGYGHPGFTHPGFGHPGFDHMAEVDDKLDQLREAIEELETNIEGLKGQARK